jgi:hypothetical protein
MPAVHQLLTEEGPTLLGSEVLDHRHDLSLTTNSKELLDTSNSVLPGYKQPAKQCMNLSLACMISVQTACNFNPLPRMSGAATNLSKH